MKSHCLCMVYDTLLHPGEEEARTTLTPLLHAVSSGVRGFQAGKNMKEISRNFCSLMSRNCLLVTLQGQQWLRVPQCQPVKCASERRKIIMMPVGTQGNATCTAAATVMKCLLSSA